MSIYTETLKELAKYSKRFDDAKANENDFAELQKLRDQIILREHQGYYDSRKRKMLWNICDDLVNECREIIRIKESIRQIHREIARERRKEARGAAEPYGTPAPRIS